MIFVCLSWFFFGLVFVVVVGLLFFVILFIFYLGGGGVGLKSTINNRSSLVFLDQSTVHDEHL